MSNIPKGELSEDKINEFQREDKYIKTESPWSTISKVDHWNLTVGSRHNVTFLPQVWGEDNDDFDWNISQLSAIFSDEEILNRYRSMTDEINDLYKYVKGIGTAHLKLKELEADLHVIVWSPSRELFVRGKITSTENDESVETKKEKYRIHAFDFDEYLCVTEQEVFPMCTRFLTLLPQVVSIKLDGFEKFSRSPHLHDVIQHNKTWKKYQYSEWTILVTRVKSNVAFCKINPSNLDLNNTNHNFNFDVLQTLWTTCTEPSLPKLNESRLRAFVVNYEEDGKLAIQYDSPYYSTWREYVGKARKKLHKLVVDDAAFQEFVAPLPLDPNEIYMAPYILTQGLELEYDFFRAKIIPDESTSEKLKDGEVRLKYIDFGNEDIERTSSLVLASKINPLMGIVPPMCVEAYMENIYSLDKHRIAKKGIINDVTPFIIQTVQEEDKSKGKLGIVRVYRETDEDSEFIKHYQDLSSYLISLKIAIEDSRPSSKSHKKSKRTEAKNNVTPADREPVEVFQATYIDMKDWKKDFTSLGNRSLVPTSATGQRELDEEKEKVEEESNKIYFKIGRVQSPQDFTIATTDAVSRIRYMSDEIEKHVSTRWYSLGKKSFDLDSFIPRWFYGWHWNERKVYCRVRFVRYLEPTKCQEKSKAEILLVDFAEYTEVELRELERTIPLSICKIPPQAVVAKVGEDFLDVLHPNKAALEQEKTNKFSETFCKKIVCGEINYCQPDKYELMTVTFKNIMTVETTKPSKKKTTGYKKLVEL